MAIKKIRISNFKSFKELDISLDRFSLLIGANASGKSNFIQIFRFLHLISKVVGMMKDASQNKQIIVTTHNPEIVKYADIEDILLVSRGKEGFSTISRPYQKEEVKTFLENEMGIEELYVQNLLEL